MKGELPGSARGFLCPTCWQSLADGAAPACPDCAAPVPTRGWPALPCSFRGRYVLTDPIGRDASSALFRAETPGHDGGDPHTPGPAGGPVVLLEVARSDGGADTKKLFRREATLAGLLAEETDAFFGLSSIDLTDPAYIAFEHVPWPSLRDELAASGPLEPEAAAYIGVAILHGLAALERHRVVHRALVPSRIFALRGEDGRWSVKIAGFGVWPDGGEDARSPEILSCASPEELRGEPLTSASDVHMVASVIWQLVTGEVPFPLEEGIELERASRLRLRRLARVPARPAAMPAELHELLSVALRPDPRARCTEGAHDGSPVLGLGSALERVAEALPRRERELSLARGDLDTTKRSLAELSARLAPLEALLARKAEIEATVERLATLPESPSALRRGARGAQLAAMALEADVEQALTPPPAPAASPGGSPPIVPVATTSEPAPAAVPSEPPRAPEPSKPPPPSQRPTRPAPSPASFPPPSRPSPPPVDSAPKSAPPGAPDSMFPKGASVPPESVERYDIPGVGASRWPYVVGGLCVVAIAIAIVLLTGSKETTSPGATSSASASAPAPASAAPPASAPAPLPPASASATAAPRSSASAAPTASAVAPPRPKPPPRPRPPDEEPAPERAPDPE